MNSRPIVTNDYLSSLSDDNLRHTLLSYGFPNIPVTETTRKILINKLSHYLSHELKSDQKSAVTKKYHVNLCSKEDTTSIKAYNQINRDYISIKNKLPYLESKINSGQKVHNSLYVNKSLLSYINSSSNSQNKDKKLKNSSQRHYILPAILSSESEDDIDHFHYLSHSQNSNQHKSFPKNVTNKLLHLKNTWRSLSNLTQWTERKGEIDRSNFEHQHTFRQVCSSSSATQNVYPTTITSRFVKQLIRQRRLKQTIVPYILIGVLLCFFLVLIFAYMFINSEFNNIINLKNTKFRICNYDNEDNIPLNQLLFNCIEKENVEKAIDIVKFLYSMLQKRTENDLCSDQNQIKTVSKSEIVGYMYKHSSKVEIKSILKDFQSAEYLITNNLHWKIRHANKEGKQLVFKDILQKTLYPDSNFLLLKPRLTLKCTIQNKLQSFFVIIGITSLIGLFWILLNLFYNYLKRRNNEKSYQVEQITNKIIDELVVLASNSDSSLESARIKVDVLRDKIMCMCKRTESKSAWNDSIKNLELTDNRIQFGIVIKNGIEYKTVKWISDINTNVLSHNMSKQWQSPAFNKTNKIISPPTSCLKIRQMFDSSESNNPGIKQSIQNAILEKVGRLCKIYDIQFDKPACCVYVRCATESDAGIVHNEINGWWFDKRLVSIKFLRLQRYLTRFPNSLGGPTCLLPSNSKNLSMTQFTSRHNRPNLSDNNLYLN